MRIRAIFYIVCLTYISFIFIMNLGAKVIINFIFFKTSASLILIFLISLLLGGIIVLIICSKKVSYLKKAIRELKTGHENKR